MCAQISSLYLLIIISILTFTFKWINNLSRNECIYRQRYTQGVNQYFEVIVQSNFMRKGPALRGSSTAFPSVLVTWSHSASSRGEWPVVYKQDKRRNRIVCGPANVSTIKRKLECADIFVFVEWVISCNRYHTNWLIIGRLCFKTAV